jgi:hypothetical protein
MADDSQVRVWATAISTNADNGKKIFFRFAKEFGPSFDRTSQPVRVIIVWRYQSETGQPIADEFRRMNELEDALAPILDQDRFATLALVSTGEGLREWTYYAQSENEFEARFEHALAEHSVYPIEIHAAHDPTWQMYEEFKSGIRMH